MKHRHKTKALIVILCLCINSVFAQTFKDVFNPETTITWLGIDFTNVKVIGHTDAEVTDLVDRQFSGINQLVLNEPKKYDVAGALHRSTVPSELSFVTEKNKTISAEKIISTDVADEKHLTDADINGIVKGYNFGDKKGIGLLFIMESMSKKNERGSIYLTFVDMATSKVLHTERVSEKCGGFGLRNYWAKSIYEAIDDIHDSKYKEWQKSNS
ncbi:MAG TPA: hypothetical protein VFW07_19830 [Parafilimonas sp.]|nr:hypothetical protein [Parafilimonas sp.]